MRSSSQARVSSRYRSQCRPGTGTGSGKCRAGTGATLSSRYRNFTNRLNALCQSRLLPQYPTRSLVHLTWAFQVDLWGRLSNPPDTLESVADQGFHEPPSADRKASKAAKRSLTSPRAGDPNNRGQLSNPTKPTPHRDNEGVDSPTSGRSSRRLGLPVLRRLTRSEIEDVVTGYQSGRSLADLAQELGIHHRTVADHLERLGVARRVNLPKMSPADVRGAAIRYRAGESLATVGKVLNVDASTVQRALKRAGVTIRPLPGR